MKQKIGTVYVDAGIVMIGDPCYTLPDTGSERGDVAKDWQKFCAATFADGGDSDKGVQPLGKGIGMVVSSGYGDGEYPVYVERTHDGVVKSVTVEFITDEDEEFWG